MSLAPSYINSIMVTHSKGDVLGIASHIAICAKL